MKPVRELYKYYNLYVDGEKSTKDEALWELVSISDEIVVEKYEALYEKI